MSPWSINSTAVERNLDKGLKKNNDKNESNITYIRPDNLTSLMNNFWIKVKHLELKFAMLCWPSWYFRREACLFPDNRYIFIIQMDNGLSLSKRVLLGTVSTSN